MLKAIFKIFFSRSFREAWALRYETYGWVRKILILLMNTALTFGAIICEFIAFDLFKENAVLAIVLCVVFIALGVLAFRFSLFFGGLALKMAFHGTVRTGLFARKKNKNNLESAETQTTQNEPTENAQVSEPTQTNSSEAESANLAQAQTTEVVTNPKKYATRGLDFVIGILGFVYAIGVVAVLVIVLFENIEQLKK